MRKFAAVLLVVAIFMLPLSTVGAAGETIGMSISGLSELNAVNKGEAPVITVTVDPAQAGGTISLQYRTSLSYHGLTQSAMMNIKSYTFKAGENSTTATWNTSGLNHDAYDVVATYTAPDGTKSESVQTLFVCKNKDLVSWVPGDGGKWYYYDFDGNWLKDNGDEYRGVYLIGTEVFRFDSTGTMHTGWFQDKASWYYFKDNGVMATGWEKVGGVWYYLMPHGNLSQRNPEVKGNMATNWLQVDGEWYLFNTGGAMQTGWKQSGGKWYYLNSGGDMATGWKQVGGVWYYMRGGGDMATGWVKDGSAWYYMYGSGAMATGWVKDGSTWYWMNSSGAMVTGTQSIGGKTYKFSSSGAWIG